MSFITLLAISTILPTCVLAVCVSISGHERIVSNYLLGALLAIVAMLTFSTVILSDWKYMRSFPFAYLLSLTVILIGPLYLLFLKSSLERMFRFKKAYFLMFVPFLATLGWFTYHTFATDIFYGANTEKLPYKLVEFIQNATYFAFVFVVLRRNQVSIRRFLLDFHDLRLTWLRFLFVSLIVFSLNSFVVAILNIIWPYARARIKMFSIVYFVFACAFLCVTIYVFLNRTELFGPRRKYTVSTLSEDDKARYHALLVDSMRRGKTYLDPSLTLPRLARRVKIPAKVVSQVINEKEGLNFNDFVNDYRIKEFCGLVETRPVDTPILELLLDAGFNSKSTFNDVFKKKTGMTPSEYRMSQKK